MQRSITETQIQPSHYREPDWFTRQIMNRLVSRLTRAGLSVWGSRVLEHQGRRSGQVHHTPVNLLTYGGRDYLVSARGETQWVRNVRAADGELVLIKGRRRQALVAVEIPVAERTAVLRSYLARWKFEVGMFFDGVGPEATDAELQAIAARHPVFVLTETAQYRPPSS